MKASDILNISLAALCNEIKEEIHPMRNLKRVVVMCHWVKDCLDTVSDNATLAYRLAAENWKQERDLSDPHCYCVRRTIFQIFCGIILQAWMS